MTMVVLLVLAGLSVAAAGMALIFCAAGARADRRLRVAMLDALEWCPQDELALLEPGPVEVPYERRAAN